MGDEHVFIHIVCICRLTERIAHFFTNCELHRHWREGEFICFCQARQARGIMSVCPTHLFVCYQTCEQDTLKTSEPSLMQIGTSGTWGEDFVGEEVESQGHARPKLHLEAWQRHQS